MTEQVTEKFETIDALLAHLHANDKDKESIKIAIVQFINYPKEFDVEKQQLNDVSTSFIDHLKTFDDKNLTIEENLSKIVHYVISYFYDLLPYKKVGANAQDTYSLFEEFEKAFVSPIFKYLAGWTRDQKISINMATYITNSKIPFKYFESLLQHDNVDFATTMLSKQFFGRILQSQNNPDFLEEKAQTEINNTLFSWLEQGLRMIEDTKDVSADKYTTFAKGLKLVEIYKLQGGLIKKLGSEDQYMKFLNTLCNKLGAKSLYYSSLDDEYKYYLQRENDLDSYTVNQDDSGEETSEALKTIRGSFEAAFNKTRNAINKLAKATGQLENNKAQNQKDCFTIEKNALKSIKSKISIWSYFPNIFKMIHLLILSVKANIALQQLRKQTFKFVHDINKQKPAPSLEEEPLDTPLRGYSLKKMYHTLKKNGHKPSKADREIIAKKFEDTEKFFDTKTKKEFGGENENEKENEKETYARNKLKIFKQVLSIKELSTHTRAAATTVALQKRRSTRLSNWS